MSNQFRIVADDTQSGFRVLVRSDLPTFEEERNKVRHMREMGWGWTSIASELRAMRNDEEDMTSGHVHEYAMVADYVLTVMQPGDLIITPERKFIVPRRMGWA